jgi:peptidoglycan-associated lipoprotein
VSLFASHVKLGWRVITRETIVEVDARVSYAGGPGDSRAMQFWGSSMTAFSRELKIICLAALTGLAACAQKQAAPVTQPSAPVHTAPVTQPPPVTSSILPGSEQDFRVNVGDTVHFALNKYLVEDNDKSLLQRQAAWLNKYPRVRVRIEGNADERGTREYNLALGARRANAVKEYLTGQGVSADRIDTISYGKERPICSDSNEACWSQNRRGVTTITAGAATS